MTPYVDIRLGLRAYLIASPEILAVVGGSEANARIFPSQMAQGERRDSIVYGRITGQGDHHMQGPSGLSRPRVQIDAWSQTQTGAADLANLIKSRIDGFRGVFSYGTSSPRDTIEVLGVFFTDERDDYDAESQMYRTSRDYFIWYRDFTDVIVEAAGFAEGGGV